MIFSANRSCRTNPFHGTQRGRRTCIFLRMWGGFASSLRMLLLLRILLLLLHLTAILLLLLQLRLLLLVLLLQLPMLHMQLHLCFHPSVLPSEGAEVMPWEGAEVVPWEGAEVAMLPSVALLLSP